LRWFNGSVWTEHVSNNGRVSVDPVSTGSSNPPQDGRNADKSQRGDRGTYNPQRGKRTSYDKPVGIIGRLAGVGAGYVVLVYLGIPSALITVVFPQLGIPMIGLTIWLVLRAGKRVSRSTQRGVDFVSAQLARFLEEFRAYESKWGAWTSPDSDGRSQNFGGNQRFDNTPSAYEILGVRDGASPKEVRDAYYKLIKELHPDRHVNKSTEERARMEDRAKVITGAYNALKT
jgi:hypothetical protein